MGTAIRTGPLLIGAMLSYGLMGAYAAQLFQYIERSGQSDRPSVKIIVVLTTILELLQLVLMTHTTYTILVLSNHDTAVFSKTPWSSAVLPALDGLVAFLVQIFRMWSIRAFMKSVWGTDMITPFIFLLCFSQCGSAVEVSCIFVQTGNNAEQLVHLRPAVVSWLTLTIICDTLVTMSIVLPLLQHKSTTNFRRSKKIINAVVLRTVETGSITWMLAIVYLALYLRYSNSFIGVACEFILGRLYANVLLATLNARKPNNNNSGLGAGTTTDVHATFERQLEQIVIDMETTSNVEQTPSSA